MRCSKRPCHFESVKYLCFNWRCLNVKFSEIISGWAPLCTFCAFILTTVDTLLYPLNHGLSCAQKTRRRYLVRVVSFRVTLSSSGISKKDDNNWDYLVPDSVYSDVVTCLLPCLYSLEVFVLFILLLCLKGRRDDERTGGQFLSIACGFVLPYVSKMWQSSVVRWKFWGEWKCCYSFHLWRSCFLSFWLILWVFWLYSCP